MKRIIASLLGAALILTSFVSTAFASKVITGDFPTSFVNLDKTNLNYDFTENGGWRFANKGEGDYIEVVDDGDSRGSYIKVFNATSGGPALTFQPTPIITNSVNVTFDFRLGDNLCERRFYWYGDGGSTYIGYITKSTGYLTLLGNSKIAQISPNVWYNLNINYNLDLNYYSFTLTDKSNGNEVSYNGFYTDKDFKNLSQIRFFDGRSGASASAVSRIDFDNLGINKTAPIYADFLSETVFTSDEDLEGFELTDTASADVSADGLNISASSDAVSLTKTFEMGMYGKYLVETVIGSFAGDGERSVCLSGSPIVTFSDGSISVGNKVIGTYDAQKDYSVVLKADTTQKIVSASVTAVGETETVSADAMLPDSGIPMTSASVSVKSSSAEEIAATVKAFNTYLDYGMVVTSFSPEDGDSGIHPTDVTITFTNPIVSVDEAAIGSSACGYKINPQKPNEITLFTASEMEYGNDYAITLKAADKFGQECTYTVDVTTLPNHEFGDIVLKSSDSAVSATVNGIAYDGASHDYELILAEFDSVSGKLANLKSVPVSLTGENTSFTCETAYDADSYYEAYLWDSLKDGNVQKKAASFGTAPVLTVEALENGFSQNMDTGVISAGGLGMTGEGKTFVVFCPGKTPSDIDTAENLTDVISYISQYDSLESDSFAFAVSGNGGKYGIMANSVFTADAIDYIDIEHINSAIEAINSPELDIVSAVEAYNDVLCVDDTYLEGMSSEQIDYLEAQIVSYKNALEDKTLNVEAFSASYYKALCAAMIKYADSASDVEAVLDNYSSYVGIKDFETYSTYLTLNANGKETLCQRMADIGTDSFEGIEELFNDSVILAAVRHAEYQMDIGKIISDNAGYIGLSMTTYNKLSNTGAVHKELMGKSFETLAELEEAFDDAVSDRYGAENQKSKGGGGGSSSSAAVNPSFNLPAVQETPTPQEEAKPAFSDLSGYEWANDAINALASAGIISGRGNASFAPSDMVTREEFSKIAVLAFDRLSGIGSLSTGESTFSDVADGAWYVPYVSKANEIGLVNGMGDGSFGVGMNITREDIAVILYRGARAYGLNLSAGDLSFADSDSVSDYAKEAVAALGSSGIINGTPDGCFNPKAYATRSEAAKMMYELLMKGGVSL